MRTAIFAALLLGFGLPLRAAEPAPAASKTSHEKAEDQKRLVPGGASKGVAACHEDIDRFCKGLEPGQGRLGACLKAHKAALSKRCLRWAAHGGKGHENEAWGELDRRSVHPAPANPGAGEKAKPADGPGKL